LLELDLQLVYHLTTFTVLAFSLRQFSSQFHHCLTLLSVFAKNEELLCGITFWLGGEFSLESGCCFFVGLYWLFEGDDLVISDFDRFFEEFILSHERLQIGALKAGPKTVDFYFGGSFAIAELYAVSWFVFERWEFAILVGAVEVFGCLLGNFVICSG